MKTQDIIAHRLHNQHLSQSSLKKPEELVRWMGALQAQDYRMVQWAIGARVDDLTQENIEQAIADGHIIRTHLLRPTWHLVAATDLRWILKLTAPRIRVALRHRHKFLGLTDDLVTKSNSVIEDALAGNNYLLRNELVAKLEEAGFENKDNMASHLLLHAELDGIICSGPSKGQHYTYALFEERVPKTEAVTQNKALERLACIYFKSHGPATLNDFAWWSGLTKTSARKAIEMASIGLTSKEIGSQKHYWPADSASPESEAESVYLLPAYDEFLISYKDRDSIIPDDDNRKKTISNNGIFRPVIVVDRQVKGIWKRTKKEETVEVEINFFAPPTKKVQTKVEAVAEKFAAFVDKKLHIIRLSE